MKTVRILILIAVVLISLNQAALGSDSNYQESTKSFRVANGGLLSVNVNAGSITIIPWEKEEVLIKAKNLDKGEIENLKTSFGKNKVTVNFESDWGDSEVEFFINVPAKFNMELITYGGDIAVRGNIEGDINIKSAGGEIATKKVKGNFIATTAGGEIQTEDVEGTFNVNTQGGDISAGTIKGAFVKAVTAGGDIRLAKSLSGASLKTGGGDIIAGDLGGDSEVFTGGGEIKIGHVYGSIKIETSGGDINLRSAKGKVNARTSGGNMVLDKIIGSVTAKTSAGDIFVSLDPSDKSESVISTSAGNIELRIPSSAKTEIEAKIKIHGGAKYRRTEDNIYSDFQAKSLINDDEENELRGTYLLNGGGSKILLRTSESNIKIKKTN